MPHKTTVKTKRWTKFEKFCIWRTVENCSSRRRFAINLPSIYRRFAVDFAADLGVDVDLGLSLRVDFERWPEFSGLIFIKLVACPELTLTKIKWEHKQCVLDFSFVCFFFCTRWMQRVKAENRLIHTTSEESSEIPKLSNWNEPRHTNQSVIRSQGKRCQMRDCSMGATLLMSFPAVSVLSHSQVLVYKSCRISDFEKCWKCAYSRYRRPRFFKNYFNGTSIISSDMAIERLLNRWLGSFSRSVIGFLHCHSVAGLPNGSVSVPFTVQ